MVWSPFTSPLEARSMSPRVPRSFLRRRTTRDQSIVASRQDARVPDALHRLACGELVIMIRMIDPTPKRLWFFPTPGWLVLGLLAAESLLFLSERFQWFAFNSHKWWTVLITMATVGIALVLMLLWFVVALLFRWRFQFSIWSLLVLTVAVALPFSWLAVRDEECSTDEGRRRR